MTSPQPTTTPVTHEDATPLIEVRDVVKAFGKRTILNGISFDVPRGETMVIMGGSGCGKSTLLRLLIGSLKPDAGSIKLFGEETTGMDDEGLDSIRRRFGVLFQSGALLQSLTVGENVALPIQEHGRVDDAIVDLVIKMKLEMVGLTGFEDLKPSEISGGMKKRVALARALALDPELLFSDEPTSGLDPVMTAVVVTHDMTSALDRKSVV